MSSKREYVDESFGSYDGDDWLDDDYYDAFWCDFDDGDY